MIHNAADHQPGPHPFEPGDSASQNTIEIDCPVCLHHIIEIYRNLLYPKEGEA